MRGAARSLRCAQRCPRAPGGSAALLSAALRATMKLSPRRLVGIICACLAVLIACILIGLSVSIVPWNHLALVEDKVKPQVRARNDSTVHLFATPPPHPYPPPRRLLLHVRPTPFRSGTRSTALAATSSVSASASTPSQWTTASSTSRG